MCHRKILFQADLSSKEPDGNRLPSSAQPVSMHSLLLFLRSSLLGCRLLGSSFLLRRALCRFGMSLGRFFGLRVGGRYFLGLSLSLRLLRRFEALPVEGNFRDAHGGEGLPMSAQLLVLLLALVMKN